MFNKQYLYIITFSKWCVLSSFSYVTWHDSDPWNQSHSSLVMSVLGAVTEHWALNKVRSACYSGPDGQTAKALNVWAVSRRSLGLEQSEGQAGSLQSPGHDWQCPEHTRRSQQTAAHVVRETPLALNSQKDHGSYERWSIDLAILGGSC